ncbi:MAG: DUF327 family protein [Chloroflexota bacterium]
MPIRIRDRGTAESVSTTRAKGGRSASGLTKTGTTATPPAFEAQLATARRSLAHEDLDRLYLDVEEQGRRLLEKPNVAELGRYKERVRAFVEYVVKNGLKLKSSVSARELHQIVDRVDEELLGLADALLAKEHHLMELGTKIDQINGMLLDVKA